MPKIRTNRVQDHQDAVWQALLQGLEQLLAERSYEDLSFASIAKSAGMARNTLYNYAPDKATLVALAAERLNQVLLHHVQNIAETAARPADKLQQMLEDIIDWYGESDHRLLLTQTLFRTVPLEVRQRAGAPLEQTSAPVLLVLEEGIMTGAFRPYADPQLVLDLLSGIITRAAFRVIENPQQADHVKREVILFVMSALGPDAV